MIQFAIHSNFK